MRKTFNEKLRLGLNDTHFPVHHEAATELVVKIAEYLRPVLTYHKGDIFDCQAFSSHEGKMMKEFYGYSFRQHEVVPATAWISRIMRNTKIFRLLGGNHEYRIDRALIGMGMAGEALSEFFSVSQCFLQDSPIDGSRFQFIPYVPGSDTFQHYELSPELELSSRLIVVHGWSYAENAAKIHLRAAHSASILFGHTHRDEHASIRDPFTKKKLFAANSGTLSLLQPTYRHGKPTEWSLACELVYVGRRSWSYYPIEIFETRDGGALCVCPDGRELRV